MLFIHCSPSTLKTFFFFFIIGLYSNLSDENLLFSLKNLKMYIKSQGKHTTFNSICTKILAIKYPKKKKNVARTSCRTIAEEHYLIFKSQLISI